MITKLLEMALEILTDFGAPAIGVLLIAHMYYEWRFKKMQNKQDETDINVISLENDTMKNVNEVRSESQKRLDYIVDRLHSGEASTEEVQGLLVRTMIALKADSQEQWAKMNAELDRFDSELMDNLVKAIPREMHAVLGHNLEELRGDLNAFMKETRMRFTDDHKGNGAERQAIWGVVHEMKEEIRKLQSTQEAPDMFQEYEFIRSERETRPIIEEIEPVDSPYNVMSRMLEAREIPEENDLSIQDQLVDILKQDGLIPEEQTGDSGEMLNHVFFGPVETTEEIEEEKPQYLIPIREEEEESA